ncbi:MAG: FAD binding domain-containing protein [Candidatus Sumerlaeaceae bacterium]|nr:FAD binding domain-containing protein [Candidatus Sumerlaeaceae bacterium]
MSSLPEFEYATPATPAEAAALLGPDWTDTVVYAGGMDLLDLMKERITAPKRLVNIKKCDALRFIRTDDDGALRLGALVTLAEIAASDTVRTAHPALAQAAGLAATPQVRNMATLGGNLCQRPRCWYLRSEDFPCLRKGGDRCYAKEGENRYHAIFTEGEPCVIVHPSATAVALSALGAEIKVLSKGGATRTIPMAEFFLTSSQNLQRENVLKPDDLIVEVSVPGAARGLRSHYIKLREKQSYDWPLADVAVAARLEGATVRDPRIVLGSAAPVPHRAAKAEEFLANKPLTEENAARAGELAVEGAKPLAQNGYKVTLYKVIVRRALMALAGGEEGRS